MAGAARSTFAAVDPNAPPRSALQAVLPRILHAFKREPALALTACYLFIALAGIYFDYGFYQRGFGIPILSLSQIGDFLVAGLQRPVALALLISTLPVCWAFDWINGRSRRKQLAKAAELRRLPELSRWQSRLLRYFDWHSTALWPAPFLYAAVIAFYGWLFVGGYAAARAAAIHAGDVPRVTIRMNGAPGDLKAVDPKGWGYLGAVSNYVFVYDPIAGRSLILPVNAIERIQPASISPSRGSPVVAEPARR